MRSASNDEGVVPLPTRISEKDPPASRTGSNAGIFRYCGDAPRLFGRFWVGGDGECCRVDSFGFIGFPPMN